MAEGEDAEEEANGVKIASQQKIADGRMCSLDGLRASNESTCGYQLSSVVVSSIRMIRWAGAWEWMH